MVRVNIPFSYRLSKNAVWAMAARGHVFLRQEARAMRDLLTQRLVVAMRTAGPVIQNKLWIDALIQKPNHKGDAVNMLDSICDAVKKAVPLDDRWYCVRRLDWEIVKDDPRIFVGIGQEDVPHSQVCSLCGRVSPLEDFARNASTRTGRNRECITCRSHVRRSLRRAKRPAEVPE